MLLTPDARLSRYFYGVDYEPKDLKFGLMESSAKRIGNPVDQLLLFCFHYDPEEGRYGPAVMRLVRLGGVLTMLGIAIFMVVLWRKERRKKALAA